MSATAPKTEDTSARMLNLGESIQFKGNTVLVRELSLEGIVQLGPSLIAVLQAVTGAEETADAKGSRKQTDASDDPVDEGKQGYDFLIRMMKEPALLEAVKDVGAASMDVPTSELAKVGLADWMRWAVAFKKVTNWDEIRELFTHLVPPSVLGGLGKRLKNLTETP